MIPGATSSIPKGRNYSNYLEEKDINPEDLSKAKEPIENYKAGTRNKKNFPNNNQIVSSEN